jgi:UDP-N-acetylglucosamine 2-epimerase (non-hydrolysing)
MSFSPCLEESQAASAPLRRPLKVMSVFGTRPEAIKMAPLVKGLEACDWIESVVCVTAQHRQMLDQVLELFEITPQIDLNVMTPNQDLFDVTTKVLCAMKGVLEAESPDLVLVHGDTTTTFATSLACYYQRVPVGHVEAGLRTYNKDFPFPEEINRVLTDAVADLFFAPTATSYENLIRLGANPNHIYVTGNTVIDALFTTLQAAQEKALPSPVTLKKGQRLILATVHRRENFGAPLQEILEALYTLVERFEDVVLALPVHPNPNVKPNVEAILGGHPRIQLLPPQDYEPFCLLMEASTLILTDSGGVQEEAPSLGIPILVLRDETERPEAVQAGTVQLIGPHKDALIQAATRILSEASLQKTSIENPYGDGKAVARILYALRQFAEAQEQ